MSQLEDEGDFFTTPTSEISPSSNSNAYLIMALKLPPLQ